MQTDLNSYYNTLEEKINVYSHLFGVILSLIGLVLMLLKTIPNGNIYKITAALVYGLASIILYSASTLYHYEQNPEKRRVLNIFDHAAIFILIAGTYTPFALVTLKGSTGWTLLWIIWIVALGGVILKLFFTGKYNLLSTIIYVTMGWFAVWFFKPLMAHLPKEAMYWLVTGGMLYTIGSVFFSIKRIGFNHAIFHIWVLLGSLAHFVVIYKYVL